MGVKTVRGTVRQGPISEQAKSQGFVYSAPWKHFSGLIFEDAEEACIIIGPEDGPIGEALGQASGVRKHCRRAHKGIVVAENDPFRSGAPPRAGWRTPGDADHHEVRLPGSAYEHAKQVQMAVGNV